MYVPHASVCVCVCVCAHVCVKYASVCVCVCACMHAHMCASACKRGNKSKIHHFLTISLCSGSDFRGTGVQADDEKLVCFYRIAPKGSRDV